MAKEKLIKKMFSGDINIPPLFSKTFKGKGPEWNKIVGIDFEHIGRILTCHLIIEHYITNLIEIKSPEDLNWEKSRLTFSQKLNLISKIPALRENDFTEGVEIINNIRNHYSHNILSEINLKQMARLKDILIAYFKTTKKTKEKNYGILEDLDVYEDTAIIEFFTLIFCSYIAGYCASLVNSLKQK